MTRKNGPTRGERGRINKQRRIRREEDIKHPVSFHNLLMSLGRRIDFKTGQRIQNEEYPAAAIPSTDPIVEIDREKDWPTPPGYRLGLE